MSCAINRRQALVRIVGVAGAIAAALATSALAEEHPAHPVAAPDAVAMLYDNTICTGCKACMTACSEANGLPPTRRSPAASGTCRWISTRRPRTSSSSTRSPVDGFAFVKRQCMHCLDPACVTGCPFGALKKNEWGAVTWESSLCIGCRYCEVACPFEVPKFEWDNWNPKIVKCEFCFDQRLKRQPAACLHRRCAPRGQSSSASGRICWPRRKQRIAAAPDKYFENRVYGEYEAGGTQVLYLSSVAFDKIGLPKLGSTSLGHYATKVTSVIYKWLSGPILVAGDSGRGDQAKLESP